MTLPFLSSLTPSASFTVHNITAAGGVTVNGFAAPISYRTLGTGSIGVGGCANVSITYNVSHTYEVGDTVYNRLKAIKGILRKHTIKKIRTDNSPPMPAPYPPGSEMCRFCTYPPMYIDTYNAYHNEEDLVTQAEAEALIENYNLVQAAALESHVMNSC